MHALLASQIGLLREWENDTFANQSQRNVMTSQKRVQVWSCMMETYTEFEFNIT